MLDRGPIYQVLPIDLSTDGEKIFNDAVKVISMIRAYDQSGALVLDALVNVNLGDIVDDLIPCSINTLINCDKPTRAVRFSWAAQPGVTALFLMSPDRQVNVSAPPARQLVTTSAGTAVNTGIVAIGIAPTLVRPASNTRQGLNIRNTGQLPIYLGNQSVTIAGSNAGFPVNPGESFKFTGTTAAVYAVASASNQQINFLEEA